MLVSCVATTHNIILWLILAIWIYDVRVIIPYRHPIAGSRPKFRELVIALADNPIDFSTINKKHSNRFGHRQLLEELGKQAEAGTNMYLDLQDRYLREEWLNWSSNLTQQL